MIVERFIPIKRNHWNRAGRLVVLTLAATSIACLLMEFYNFCPMRPFALFVFFPAILLLFGLSIGDRVSGDGQLWRAVMIGTIAGLRAAVAYDVFRLPFVFAKELGIDSVVTLSAHLIFGVAMGLLARFLSRRFQLSAIKAEPV